MNADFWTIVFASNTWVSFYYIFIYLKHISLHLPRQTDKEIQEAAGHWFQSFFSDFSDFFVGGSFRYQRCSMRLSRISFPEAAVTEYMRRGCPLSRTAWGISQVSKFMRVYMVNKSRCSDIGAYGYFFVKGSHARPAPMPEFISVQELQAQKDASIPQKPIPKVKKARVLVKEMGLGIYECTGWESDVIRYCQNTWSMNSANGC